MTMKYKGIEAKDLPRLGSVEFYNRRCRGNTNEHTPEWARTYVLVSTNDWYVRHPFQSERFEVKWYVSHGDMSMIYLCQQYAWLLRCGGYTFRRNPVPCIKHYKNHIGRKHGIGAMSEHNHNLMCAKELSQYPNITRGKRRELIKLFATDYDYPNGYNSQRGWKRSKKSKQWM
jgi:hypothetical protein